MCETYGVQIESDLTVHSCILKQAKEGRCQNLDRLRKMSETKETMGKKKAKRIEKKKQKKRPKRQLWDGWVKYSRDS